MSTSLRLTVLTPDRVLLAVDFATRIRMKLADDAWLSVYPNHAPLIAEILPGPVQYDTDTESGEVAIAEGILQVAHGEVTILTSGLQRAPETGSTDADADADQQFDRLAEQLLMSLQAQPEPADVAASADATASADTVADADAG